MSGTSETLRNAPTEQKSKTKENTTETESCNECGGKLVPNESTSETHCEKCGLVVETDQIDHGPEWRAFNASERSQKSRVGAPRTELLGDKGLSTNIDWRNQDSNGKRLSSTQRQRMHRLRKWNKRIRSDTTNQGLEFGIGEIRRMGSALGAPKQALKTSCVIFRQAQNQEVLIGRSIESVSSASLYIGLRQHSAPRSLDEVAIVSRANRKPIMRSQRAVSRELGIETTITSPIDYLPRHATKLDAPREIEREAEQLLKDAEGTQLLVSGKRPDALAACALYAASIVQDQILTQRDIEMEIGITTVTIRNYYREFFVESDRVPITEDDLEDHSNPKKLLEIINKRST